MSDTNISFDVDERARLFALDIDQKGHLGLLPLYRDLSRVLELVSEHEQIAEHELSKKLYPELEHRKPEDIDATLIFLKELGYIEKAGRDSWSLASDSGGESSGMKFI